VEGGAEARVALCGLPLKSSIVKPPVRTVGFVSELFLECPPFMTLLLRVTLDELTFARITLAADGVGEADR
jgi:hypothetical protein